MRRNTKAKLQDLGIPEKFRTLIIDDIFGKQQGSHYNEGLVDATSEMMYDEIFVSLTRKWQEFEVSATSLKRFVDWFRTYKSSVILKSMPRPIREQAGLGRPPTQFTTNASESINAVLKRKVNYKRNELPVFLEKIKELIQEQDSEIEKAVIERGKYVINPEFKRFSKTEEEWFTRMKESDRVRHLQRFSSFKLPDVKSFPQSSGASGTMNDNYTPQEVSYDYGFNFALGSSQGSRYACSSALSSGDNSCPRSTHSSSHGSPPSSTHGSGRSSALTAGHGNALNSVYSSSHGSMDSSSCTGHGSACRSAHSSSHSSGHKSTLSSTHDSRHSSALSSTHGSGHYSALSSGQGSALSSACSSSHGSVDSYSHSFRQDYGHSTALSSTHDTFHCGHGTARKSAHSSSHGSGDISSHTCGHNSTLSSARGSSAFPSTHGSSHSFRSSTHGSSCSGHGNAVSSANSSSHRPGDSSCHSSALGSTYSSSHSSGHGSCRGSSQSSAFCSGHNSGHEFSHSSHGLDSFLHSSGHGSSPGSGYGSTFGSALGLGNISGHSSVCNSEPASTDDCTQKSAHISDVASAYSSEHESTVSSGYTSAYISKHCSHHGGSSDSSRCFFMQGPEYSIDADSEDVQPPKKCAKRQLFPPTSLSVDFVDFSDKVSVSAIILESIWNKASKLLSTSNAIAVAPGLDLKSHTVISTSGNRPHLVQAKKTGQYVCDKACGNWNSLSICSHTVAVAEVNGELFKFVAWFVKAKKKPSVTKLVLTGMPEGRGRKGGKRPQTKKKGPAMQTRTSIAELSGVTVSDTTREMGTTSNRSSASEGGNLKMPSHPPPLVHITPHNSPVSESFVLCFVTGNISVCYGCRQKYPKPCQPPHDLCVRHKEWREFFAPGSATAQTRFGNVYYHCNTPCIQARCPFFTSDMLEVTAFMAAQLLPAHTEYLATHMGRNA